VDDPFWRHPSGTGAGEGVAHLRVWTTATVPPGHLAVVTDIGLTGGVTSSAGSIRAELVRVYGNSWSCWSIPPGRKPGRVGTWTWCASAGTVNSTGLASGRPIKTALAMPRCRPGWPPMGIRSSKSRLTMPAGTRTRTAERSRAARCERQAYPQRDGYPAPGRITSRSLTSPKASCISAAVEKRSGLTGAHAFMRNCASSALSSGRIVLGSITGS